ncbi:glycogen synthase [Phytoactinopolyspora halotolerans]|uniref:Glycogen synthase n=1 Tax=Phytoactinopolyspora halotolerans TaxID=1981512 RepID=A0A6L9S991_9ACTN|nr:glycogen synthase [Phytoactinopolyspora halotolerans]NEE00540.1 glycogen synthase [Phytoactinopolyspora halotolerans]
MRVGVLTREYPPYVYGGAGVHVDFLVRHLRQQPGVDVEVHALGEPRDGAHTYAEDDPRLDPARISAGSGPATEHRPDLEKELSALRVLSADIAMAGALGGQDVVHSHTWYANAAGRLAQLLYGAAHVVTAHSLEPLRPWKAEQLGGGYRLSSWIERSAYEAADAVVAVSEGMRADVCTAYPGIDPGRVHVIRNGIDTDFYRPVEETDVLERLGVDLSRPYVTFVGRITRQKGVPHLLRAALSLPPETQLVLLAGAADTPELARETDGLVERLRAERTGVVLVSEMLPREELRQVLSHARVFCCPSVYEPLGIVNLEAMACRTAVVASDVGGIPEVVADGETGLLVHYDRDDPRAFEAGLADAITRLVEDAGTADAMGRAGRARAEAEFGWDAVAEQTVEVYRSVLAGR